MEKKPISLPLTLSLELVIALTVGVLAALIFYAILWDSVPFGYPSDYTGPYDNWFVNARQEVFWTFVGPISFFTALSAIFLFRGVSGNIRHFSRLGLFVLAWPFIDFVPAIAFGAFGFCMAVPFVGLGVSLPVAFTAFIRKKDHGDLLIPCWNMAWLIFVWVYGEAWWKLFGD